MTCKCQLCHYLLRRPEKLGTGLNLACTRTHTHTHAARNNCSKDSLLFEGFVFHLYSIRLVSGMRVWAVATTED